MAGRLATMGMGFRAGLCRFPWLKSPAVYLISSTPTSTLLAPSCPAVSPLLLPDGVRVLPDFVTPEEEGSLLAELEGKLRKGRYQDGHWDQAIHGFREIEKAHWTDENSRIIQRVRDVAFPPGVPQLFLVHVLDLKAEGYIKPHIDSVKFCGSTIAGLSLLSSSVMRLIHEQNSKHSADLLLERRSLYILSGRARYEFTHEILKNEDSVFNGQKILRERRISVICRNLPAVGENTSQTQD